MPLTHIIRKSFKPLRDVTNYLSLIIAKGRSTCNFVIIPKIALSLSLFLSRLRASVDKLSDIFSLNQDICIKLLES
jgi:hypothetical protein